MPAEPRRQAGGPGAERTGNRLREVGVPSEKIRLVTPGASRAEFEAAIPVEDTEGRGVGTVLGGILGGAIALLVSPFFVPGGPYAAIGLRGVTLIVALGAVILGTVLGATIEKTVTKGVPHDVVCLYEKALHRRYRGRPYDEVATEPARTTSAAGTSAATPPARPAVGWLRPRPRHRPQPAFNRTVGGARRDRRLPGHPPPPHDRPKDRK